jgi:hypothetical protein
MDDDTITGADPPEETVTEGQATPDPPRPSIEAYVGFRDRIEADRAVGGPVASLMREFADAQPEEIREKLASDIDAFNSAWDQFQSMQPQRPAPPAAPPPPPPPREHTVPEWRRQEIERSARRKTQVMDATFSIGPGIMPEPGTAERAAARSQQKEIDSIRARVREGSRDAEFELASKLFGDASHWKTTHGPERY